MYYLLVALYSVWYVRLGSTTRLFGIVLLERAEWLMYYLKYGAYSLVHTMLGASTHPPSSSSAPSASLPPTRPPPLPLLSSPLPAPSLRWSSSSDHAYDTYHVIINTPKTEPMYPLPLPHLASLRSLFLFFSLSPLCIYSGPT